MTETDFLPSDYINDVKEGSVSYKSPSNIALVKYWGKKENQLPQNPSISFTLDACATTTKVTFNKLEKLDENFSFDLWFEGKEKEDFKPKINTFLSRIEIYIPFLKSYHFKIETSNSFPHSSGIASSASGMSALALCFMDIEKQLNPEITADFFNKKASFLARLGSGSACRSIEGDLIQWGAHEQTEGSSDLFGIKYPYEVHENFKNFQDTILLVDKGQKQVSSTVGHNLMHNHPFAAERFNQAHTNLNKLKSVFKSGDLIEFIKIVESEALTLHAMMMTSMPYFILMKPNTLEIINKIWEFREKSNSHICFTLDAGANVHVLYSENEKAIVNQFIKDELVVFCENQQYICDQIGFGAKKL
ncbi:diphosphomevalonate decarboxylase [Cellulophaga baltica]|uniref:diphosphomevalonate decarboxylase n=1 Tax=Cellulophaga TaxID=104264 RepID=UPI001C068457|nr:MULTISPECIES: diphosphomevalonate decarboxylase [Cellulophaga]MBU2995511.1 diphosphomevalonate decarboxylase [Cellulophaga baltica]MDO6766905.1 diphosphomevalonate decarboxylase [Cellulophaga sp. 1_MG-2023]